MGYLETINHPDFRAASDLVRQAEALLVGSGLTLEEARGWIRAWASGAGDGSD